ncbi:ThiF family adenylyltransferase [Streptomyces sp. Li-HN-5-11]|uniref:ThiF family adenylyltransferase n=1 Tax=Streptomyces sp. Li-HN-5-11 TaxID=3075432 RepID=UPI0028A9FB73|nr:ThiF family adenylyltransferase [Streptomyces sp. Li-HN-5-11]WNM29984.1 ThiF family adenylyltransferase [Streptomyces sp. Li-HN-5-11]
MAVKTIQYRGDYDEKLYWERVDRNLGWLGDTLEEQRARQEKLRDAVIGIVGTGGIGGAVATRLVRMGARNLKLADPDEFDIPNIQRQLGASLENVGRNKAEVVAEMAFDLTRDVNIDVYPQGITPETAEQFMDGCDYVMDQMEFYQVQNRYALHRAFRASDRCRFMFKIPTVSHKVFVFTYTHDSMPIEEVYDLPEDGPIDDFATRRLMERIIPEMPEYPGTKMLDEWFVGMQRMPIFGACPPLAEGILVERLAQEIMEIPGRVALPVQPGYAVFDSLTWESKVVERAWWAK